MRPFCGYDPKKHAETKKRDVSTELSSITKNTTSNINKPKPLKNSEKIILPNKRINKPIMDSKEKIKQLENELTEMKNNLEAFKLENEQKIEELSKENAQKLGLERSLCLGYFFNFILLFNFSWC